MKSKHGINRIIYICYKYVYVTRLISIYIYSEYESKCDDNLRTKTIEQNNIITGKGLEKTNDIQLYSYNII